MPHKAKGFTQDDRKKQKATKLSNLINMRMGINQLQKMICCEIYLSRVTF